MKIDWKTCFRICTSIFILYLCISIFPGFVNFITLLIGAAMPLIIGGIIAYIVNILMSFYEKYYFRNTTNSKLQRSRRPVCMIAAFITLIAVIVLIIRLVVPQLVSCVQLIFAEFPGFMDNIILLSEEWGILSEDIANTLSTIDWQSRIGEIIKVLTSGIGNVMDVLVNAISSVFSWIVTGLLSIIFAVYILSGKENLIRQYRRVCRNYLKREHCQSLTYILEVINHSFRKYIVGQCTEAVILGALCTVGMLILGLPYASMTGALIAFTALIPVAGGYIGAGIGAFMILTVSPIKALVFLVFIVILQQFEGNVIYPRVVGSSLGLPGIWVLAAVTIGGGLMGIPGMLLGVPLTSALYRFVDDDMKRKENNLINNCKKNSEEDNKNENANS